jgi:hypothetical protein
VRFGPEFAEFGLKGQVIGFGSGGADGEHHVKRGKFGQITSPGQTDDFVQATPLAIATGLRT